MRLISWTLQSGSEQVEPFYPKIYQRQLLHIVLYVGKLELGLFFMHICCYISVFCISIFKLSKNSRKMKKFKDSSSVGWDLSPVPSISHLRFPKPLSPHSSLSLSQEIGGGGVNILLRYGKEEGHALAIVGVGENSRKPFGNLPAWGLLGLEKPALSTPPQVTMVTNKSRLGDFPTVSTLSTF
jgi:hypothetical protein